MATRRGFLKAGSCSLLPLKSWQPAVTPSSAAGLTKLPHLEVHRDGHLLQASTGAPFFWLADTAWQLMHALTAAECEYYLAERARQGFTVIQVVVLCETKGIRQPNAMGLTPFVDVDSLRPNPAYFDHLAHVVDVAAENGLYVALLPTWADKLTAPWGEGPRLFRADDLPRVRAYASFLAARLKTYSSVVWMLGGDRPAWLSPDLPQSVLEGAQRLGLKAGTDWRSIWAIFAAEIQRNSDHPPLLLYHPQGGRESTSVLLRDTAWLSVNGMQSGHGSGHNVPVWEWVGRDVALQPAKPTIDLEPNYEDHPVSPWPQWDPAKGYFRDSDVRRQVYRAVFAGACGTTYGHHSVWQFASAREPIINYADFDWKTAMQRPAGRQMVYLRNLMLSRPYFGRTEAPEVLPGQTHETDPGRQAIATLGADGAYAMIYFPEPSQTLTVDYSRVRGLSRRAWWFDPQTGSSAALDLHPASTRGDFTSPSGGVDAVLVIEDATLSGSPPGVRRYTE